MVGTSKGDCDAEAAAPRCAACGYLLYGLPENRCPECGLRFEPEQWKPKPVQLPPINWRPWARGVLIASPVLLLAAQWRTFDPFDDIADVILWWPGWGLVLWGWLLFLGYSLAHPPKAASAGAFRLPWRWLCGLTAPVLFIVAVESMNAKAPFRLQFWMSRSALVRLEASVRGSKTSSLMGTWNAGAFTINQIDVDTTSAYFETDRNIFLRHRSAGQSVPADELDLGGGWSAGRRPVS